MSYWLVKSEPDSFSWAQMVANRVEPWTGVRNHEARRHLENMRRDDLALFYHSNIGREIVGIVRVCREAYPDPTAIPGDLPGPWRCVDVEAVAPLPRPVTLAAIRNEPRLAELALLRRSRLSVIPVAPEHWEVLAAMAGHPAVAPP